MLQRVRDYIDTHQLIQSGQSVLVGVSGGVDSMVLLHVLLELGYDVHAAHVNYQLRGTESDGDEALVKQYCSDNKVPFYSTRADPALKKASDGRSFQEKARTVRYDFFEEKARALGIDRIAVAHHQDDQAETILLKLIKGSGLEGMGGMRPKRRMSPDSPTLLIRPLLDQSRGAIQQYAIENSLLWREDASNKSEVYQRNAMRNRIIPLMKEHFGESVSANLAQSASILQGYWEEALQPELEKRVASCMNEPGQVGIDALHEQSATWAIRVALDILYTWMPGYEVSRSMAEALLELSHAQVGRRMVLPTGTVWREREVLVFVPGRQLSSSKDEIWITDWSSENTIVFLGGILDISMQIDPPESLTSSHPNIIQASKDALTLPLTLRPWKAGDRIVPFGMTGHKKVSDVLTDAKIPSHLRASTYVLEANGEIAWILGVRMAEGLRVSEATKEVVRMEFRPDLVQGSKFKVQR